MLRFQILCWSGLRKLERKSERAKEEIAEFLDKIQDKYGLRDWQMEKILKQIISENYELY